MSIKSAKQLKNGVLSPPILMTNGHSNASGCAASHEQVDDHPSAAKRCHQSPLNTLSATIYGLVRTLCILSHNIYHVFGFFVLTWIVLLPLYYLRPKLYSRIENQLYYWCLYTVGSWSWLAGIQVVECGDDVNEVLTNFNKNNNSPTRHHHQQNGGGRTIESQAQQQQQATTDNSPRDGRIMLLANHQSMGDVPLMFQAFVARAQYILLWVMDHQFKFTHFGLVSATHGDYFIKAKQFVKNELTKHCSKYPDNNLVILFPEGGFRYKRAESSNRFAMKQNWPVLQHLTWPRAGAFNDLAHKSLGVTHVVDLSILFADQSKPISISDIIFATRPGPIYFHYRSFTVGPDTVLDDQWLHDRWLEKEQLLHSFYTDRASFLRNHGGRLRPIQLSLLKMFNIHLFYLATVYCVYLAARVAWLCTQP